MTDDSKLLALTITVDGPQLRADQQGYLVDGESVDGFGDRPDLDAHSRRLIAQWCQAFAPDALGAEQRQLLRGTAAPPSQVARELRDAAIENAERDMPLAVDVGLRGRLGEDEIRKVREPWLVLGGDPQRDYPLNTSELATLTGATPKQIRSWEESELLPAYWIADRRHFFSAAAVHAFALRELDRNEIRSARRVLSADPEDVLPELVAAALERSRHTATPSRLTVLISDKPLAAAHIRDRQRPKRRAVADPIRSFDPVHLEGFGKFRVTPLPRGFGRLASRVHTIAPRPSVSFVNGRRETSRTWAPARRPAGELPDALHDIVTLAKSR